VVTYTYDDGGQLASVTDWLENATSYTYDDAGNVLSASYPNGVTATYTYDDAGRLTSVVNSQGETTLSSYTYTLDAVGNRTQMVDLSGTHSYEYDDLYRLTEVTYPNDDEVSYAYDANGNRTTMTVNDTPTSYTYDDADQMTQAGGTSYTYDDNGNQTGRGDDSFSYDYENRLTQATVGGTTSSFTYNGLGRRVSKTVGENTTDYVWSNSGSLPVVVYDGDYYVYGLGLIAKTDSQDSQLYYLADGLASTTGLTDDQGDVVGTYTYDVFGAIRSETGGQANDYRFTGQQLDVASGLYYLRARYYDPASARFLTRDSFRGWFANPQSQNPYAYVTNNPVFYVDPMGLWGLRDLADAAGKVGDVVGDAAGSVGDAAGTVGDVGGTLGDALGDLELDDLGYVDLNGTVCLGLCLTGGLQASFGEGLHPYVGTGYGLAIGASASVAPGQHITTGWSCGSSWSAGAPVGGTFQFGYSGYGNKEGESFFHEYGVAVGPWPVGLSNTCYYVW
jgi:RHS repeat-associated protein